MLHLAFFSIVLMKKYHAEHAPLCHQFIIHIHILTAMNNLVETCFFLSLSLSGFFFHEHS